MDERQRRNRWVILIAAIVAIAALLGYCTLRDREPASPGGIAEKPAGPPAGAPKESAAPGERKPEAPSATVPPQADTVPATVTVLFEFDRSTLRPDELAKLGELASRLAGKTPDRLDAVGYADRIGSEAYNLQLSERRAEAVKGYLAGKGLAVRTQGKGETESATGGACAKLAPETAKNPKLVECLQPDRRVVIAISGAR
jgi:OOP family OmpA-OmpF porin